MSTKEALLQSVTLVDPIFSALELDIVSGRLPMGSKLGEEVIAARFGVSRGPLREALRRLEGRGLVARTAHAGVRVVTLSRRALLELYEMRELLEGLSAKLAARNMLPEEIEGLRKILDNDLKTDIERNSYPLVFGEADFHFKIAEGSHSDRLQKLLCGDLYSLIRLCRYRTHHVPGGMQSFRDHERIVEAITDRDEVLAEFLMRRHIASARERFRAAPDREGPEIDEIGLAGFN